jgi:hypothetical protein
MPGAYQRQLRPLPIPDRAWKDITVDFVGPLPESNGTNTIVVVVDRLTKALHYVACKAGDGGVSSEATAMLFLSNVRKIYGLPSTVVSDRGT